MPLQPVQPAIQQPSTYEQMKMGVSWATSKLINAAVVVTVCVTAGLVLETIPLQMLGSALLNLAEGAVSACLPAFLQAYTFPITLGLPAAYFAIQAAESLWYFIADERARNVGFTPEEINTKLKAAVKAILAAREVEATYNATKKPDAQLTQALHSTKARADSCLRDWQTADAHSKLRSYEIRDQIFSFAQKAAFLLPFGGFALGLYAQMSLGSVVWLAAGLNIAGSIAEDVITTFGLLGDQPEVILAKTTISDAQITTIGAEIEAAEKAAAAAKLEADRLKALNAEQEARDAQLQQARDARLKRFVPGYEAQQATQAAAPAPAPAVSEATTESRLQNR